MRQTDFFMDPDGVPMEQTRINYTDPGAWMPADLVGGQIHPSLCCFAVSFFFFVMLQVSSRCVWIREDPSMHSMCTNQDNNEVCLSQKAWKCFQSSDEHCTYLRDEL